MYKKVIGSICTISALAILSLPLVGINNAKANTLTQDNFIATTDSFALANTKFDASKNETVYLITNPDGSVKNTFIGSTLYTDNKTLPFESKISYYLNDQEISGEAIAHQSGHVKIVYKFTATALYQYKKIPFAAITGLNLDSSKFKNLTIKNGKIIRDGEKTTVVGYSLLGLDENFGTDFLSNSFTVEADVSDFTLDTAYTVLLNDIFANLDTTKLTDLDSLVSAINQLSDGVDQLVSGSTTLSDGLKQFTDGTSTLQSGVEALASGISGANDGAATLSAGLSQITENNATLQAGATAIITSTLQNLNANPTVQYVLSEMHLDAVTVENYNTVISAILAQGESAELTQAKAMLDFSTGVIGYTKAVKTTAAGAKNLSTGLGQINAKMPELSSGIDRLVGGASELYAGSVKLNDGIKTLKEQGIDRLVNFANQDLTSFTWNLRQTVSAAKSYKNYANPNAESVKFIVKTASIQ